MTPVLSTVILDPTTAMVGGAALALFSAKLIWKSPEVELKRTIALGAVWGLYYGLTVAWMYFNYTDWMLAYLVDSRNLSVPLTFAIFVAVLVIHGAVAAAGVGALVMHKKLGWAIAIAAGIGLTNLLIMALQGHAYNHFGTYAEYWAGTAKELSQDPRAQMGMTVAGLLAAPGGIGALVVRFVMGRRASRTPATPAQSAVAA